MRLFGMPVDKGRWLLIPLGAIVLLCLGTVYSWSIFRKPLEKLLNINATESLLPFTVLLIMFAILMPITGFYINRFGSRTITAVGGVIMGLGYILSSLDGNLQLLTVTYGAIAGAGVGIVYGVPLAVIAKWFPDKKGIAVGLTVIGFGLSPLITAPLAKSLIDAYGVRQTFVILGIIFTLIILAIATVLKTPPPDWKPADWNPNVAVSGSTALTNSETMLQTPAFYGLWLCYTIGTFSGLAAIGISSPLAQEIIKLDATTAASTVSLFAVFNALGRIFFGWFTDRFSPKLAAIVSFTLVLIASLMMLKAGQGTVATYLVAFSLFYFSFGGWLAIAPTTTLILFSSADYAKNYGLVFTAYGAGALGGTLLAGRIRDIFGSYTIFFYPTTALAILGIVLAVFMLKRSFSTSTSVAG
ncbi:OFA family MFS transporter [Nostoc sp. FACHB-87]|uniref:L-lactate MFS transporter n=2 Tax=Nostocales TaxID=1161 RepID=UPI00168A0B66|nr:MULTISPECIES: OFA family MFS transporter [Nostocaceae]MBD2301870.1 OFA family MFS transporter [Nostoc sp. FACHB-190]MBD2457222.1 OFA family MFS transporter [Nostoc sp. FACHB-87]MBD2478288.1 OFA family MFS transporter [Anabaena sp. FACHB-83]